MAVLEDLMNELTQLFVLYQLKTSVSFKWAAKLIGLERYRKFYFLTFVA